MGAAVAVPAIIQGASAIGAWWSNRKKNQAAKKEREMYSGPAMAGANILASTGTDFMRAGARTAGQGVNQLTTAGDYFRRIVNGNRAEMATALMPETSRINEMYTGANKGMFNLRGPTKDRQLAENNRQRLSSLGQMIGGARGSAASSLGQIGSQLGQLGLGESAVGMSGMQGAGSIWSRLLGGAEERGLASDLASERTGQATGNLLFSVLRNVNWGGGGGNNASAALPNAASSSAINRAYGGIRF